ncbi:hypothetical protein [Herbaspirillum sp. SJZ099]|uniref:hypothetical protein n=1 Tax=Herbaspirillum sp. SJZ099 TaxID=2572916 RepID=UPI0011AA1E75|nr:hypothetical protein [Herbaspirillum sp. SJZ099]TWC64027.1 hypothetical protein FB597_1092 [Herbaspirillum sp. SJZ099]
MKSTTLSILLCMFCLPALAVQGRWTEGFGQGNLEYFVDTQGYRLYIGCPTQDGSANAYASVALNQLKNNASIKQFTISVNGHTFNGPFDADSRVGTQNFVTLIDDLRKADAVVEFSGKSITLPKSDAAKVLPVQKKLECNLF